MLAFFFKRVKRSHLKNTVSLKCYITKCASALNGTGVECKHIQSKCHERRKIRRCLADMLYIFRFSSLHALCFILSVYICHCQVEEMRSYTLVAISVPWAGNRKCCFSKQHHSGIVIFWGRGRAPGRNNFCIIRIQILGKIFVQKSGLVNTSRLLFALS